MELTPAEKLPAFQSATGINKLEYFTAAILHGLCSSEKYWNRAGVTPDDVAANAIKLAKAAVRQLNG